MAKKFNTKKAFISFLWWTALYLPVVVYYVYHDLGINLLSIADMQYKYNGFVSGQWSMNTTDTLLFLGTVILFFPLWVIGTVMLYKIEWKGSPLFKTREKNFKQKLVLKIKNDTGLKPKMPIKLKLKSVGESRPSVPVTAPLYPNPSNDTDTTHSVLSSVEKNGPEEIISQLSTLVSKYNVESFENINLDGYLIPLALSTDDETAILITIVHEPDSQLIIDPTEGIAGDWFGTLTPLPSPAKFVKEAMHKLQELEADSQVIPVIVLAGGEITDCDQVTEMLIQEGIILTRFSQGGPETLETIEEFLDKILPLKSNPNAPSGDSSNSF